MEMKTRLKTSRNGITWYRVERKQEHLWQGFHLTRRVYHCYSSTCLLQIPDYSDFLFTCHEHNVTRHSSWHNTIRNINLLSSSSLAFAIDCYHCNSSDTSQPFECGEWFDRFDKPDIKPSDCSSVHGAKYCIKHIGRFEGSRCSKTT